MSTIEEKVEKIKKFLEGGDDQKYITGIEGEFTDNEVTLMIDDPIRGKYVERQKFVPFVFIKDFKKAGKKLYPNKADLDKAMKYNGISITKLRTDDHPRLEYGYKYMIKTTKTYGNIINFFGKANINMFKEPDRNMFLSYSSLEQFFITTGKRLFKGFQTYNDVHKFYFDIETTSLKGSQGQIFLIGMKDNRGFEKVLTIDKRNPIESEKQMIIDFFNIIVDLKPSIVAGYNSEAFDFTYIIDRANILGINLLGFRDDDNNMHYDVRTSLNSEYPMKRMKATIKFGGETENYEKTIMWGINVIDIAHSVRATKAINSDIKGWGLKYICKYKGFAKPNRMYVEGDKIYKIWDENKNYYINKSNNSYRAIPTQFQDKPEEYIPKLKVLIERAKTIEDKTTVPKLQEIHDFFDGDINNVGFISGAEIVHQYLIDDIYETEMVDNDFNQSNFMMGSILPTPYVRASTMGNASKWKMLMATYSYENGIAIPTTDRKRDIVGGLSRLLRTGFAKNVLKMDFASLYPSIQLTHKVFPSLDITGVMEAMLTYFKDGRAEYKSLSKKHATMFKEFGLLIDKELASLFDTKQLPIKILANSQFGALGSPAIFNWGDNDIAEEITCTGRQYLRSMVKHFLDYGFGPIVLDTDGTNLSMPDNIDTIVCHNANSNPYMGKRKNEVTKEMEDYVLTGYESVLAEYNDKYMYGAMNLSLDGLYTATINISRKNYADLNTDGSIKIVGNSLKSSTLQAFIEKTFNKCIRFLLEGKGKEFIEEYYHQIEKIYNKQIPLIEIANKARVKQKVKDYQYDKIHKKQTNGRAMSQKAYMELLIEANLDPDLGQNIYYINNGNKKSHGDIGNSYLIDEMEFLANPDKTGEYNVAKYLDAFNKRMSVFLVCFGKEVRESLLVTNPEKRGWYTDEEMELVSGMPLCEKGKSEEDVLFVEDHVSGLHSNEPLFEMSEREIDFWNMKGLDPKEIFSDFTTSMSHMPLLTQDEQVIKRKQESKIIEFFNNSGVEVKRQMDFLLPNEMFITYRRKFFTVTMGEKEKINIEESKLDEPSWILSKIEYGVVSDIQIIDKEIYSEVELVSE